MKYNLSAPESIILYLCGGLVLLLAICTRYESRVIGLLPVTAHLTTDCIKGVSLALAPTLLDFSQRVYLLPYCGGFATDHYFLLYSTVAGPDAKKRFKSV